MVRIRRHLLMITLTILLLSSCSQAPSNQAQGYIEGRYTYIATPVSGVLKELLVARGTRVNKGQLLFVLEQQPESDIYNAAIENLQQAKDSRDAIAANLAYAKITDERYKVLVPEKAISQSQLDNAQSNYNANLAQLAQADANIATSTAALAQSKWTLEQKTVYAPVDAIVFDTYYRLGEYTLANQSILSLLAPADIKAIFYVSEADLASIKLGDTISVHCDSCAQSYRGTVSFISPSAEYTPPVIYSNTTSEKLIYRIEAEFSPDDAYYLHPGQPVMVTYNLRN